MSEPQFIYEDRVIAREGMNEVEVGDTGTVVVERLTNRYVCEVDGEWTDEWCCACDDECPTCGKDYSPEASVVEETVVLRVNIDDCPVCGDAHEF